MSEAAAARSVLRSAVVCAGVGAATFLLRSVIPANAATAGFAFLIIVLFAATRWGLAEAITGSLAAVLCFNFFFLPPLGMFTIADPAELGCVRRAADHYRSPLFPPFGARAGRTGLPKPGEREREIGSGSTR